MPAALLTGLTAASLAWAYDPPASEDRVAFFVLPFAALLAVVARAPFRPWLPRVLAIEAVALACLFAAVGIAEAWARKLLFYDPKVAVANEYTSYFRVTSLFSDPSIYGRHLAIAMAILVVALWLARINVLAGAALLAFLWVGLFFSYSQSSMLALAAATVVVTFLAADRRSRRWLVIAAAAVVLVGSLAFVTLLRDESADRVTSGRSALVRDTLTVVGNHPVAGVGVASQPLASRDEADGPRRARRNVSHTAPLTIAAELGILGLMLYVAFLAGATKVFWMVRRRDAALGLGLIAVFVVLVVHSLFYGVFFDDPILWATLGVGSAASVALGRTASVAAAPPTSLPVSPGPRRPMSRVARSDVRLLLAVLGGLVLLGVPVLGAEPWDFRPDRVDPTGPFAFYVRGTDGEWDVEAVRAPALLAGVLLVVAAALAPVFRLWPRWLTVALTIAVVGLLAVPAVVLQAGLRQSTEPWFHTNDSTYQIELAGELLRDGENPYGNDYSESGLERFYPLDGSVNEETREEQVALRHFAYWPGTVLTAAVWTLLPEPWSDYRFFVLLATLGGLAVALVFPGPLAWRLALGATLAASPLAVRAAWFGTADAASLALTVLAFALAMRRRVLWAAVALAAALLLKQFALVALPFLAVLVLQQEGKRDALKAGGLFAGIVAAGVLPFFVWDPGAFWADTIEYGGSTYRIVGYGLSGLLLEAGILDSRTGSYPFLPLLFLVWLPLTAWLLWCQWRSRELWTAPAGFAVSLFALVFLGRVFHGSYLVWPFAGIAVAAFLAAVQRVPSARSQVPGIPPRR